MRIEISKKLFTVDDYYRMAEAGILTEDDRVELIDGEILQMSAIGSRHLGCVNRASTLFVESFGRRCVVSTQNPVQLSAWTEPQPDIVVLNPRPDFYASKKPMAEDVLLVLEVADTTLSYDRDIKVPRYAAAGIQEVWIESLVDDRLLVYRDPAETGFRTSFTLERGKSISPMAFPDNIFTIDDLLG